MQASFNRLQSLPTGLTKLPSLELLRVAVNNLSHLPEGLTGMRSLAWISLAGNPVCAPAPAQLPDIVPLSVSCPQGCQLYQGAALRRWLLHEL